MVVISVHDGQYVINSPEGDNKTMIKQRNYTVNLALKQKKEHEML